MTRRGALRLSPGRAALATTVAAALDLFIGCSTADAHHGVTGRYDARQPISLTGVVTRATFSPPHPVITIQVVAGPPPARGAHLPRDLRGPVRTRAEDVGQIRTVEFTPANRFYSLRSQVRVGDTLQVIAMRNCLAPHQLRSWWIRLANGQIVVVNGDWARKVDRC